jgi:chromate transporter
MTPDEPPGRPPDARAHIAPAGLDEIARVFLKLSLTAFGGPAAHVAMMEEEVVRRRGWLTRAEFLDYLGATHLIPGPNSTELAIHVGHARAGWPGLLVAGASFILPASLLVGVAAWAYVRYGTRPEAGALLYGVKAVVVSIVAQAVAALGRSAVKDIGLGVLGLAGIAALLAGVHELVVLAGSGALMCLVALAALSGRRSAGAGIVAFGAASEMAVAAAGTASTAAAFGLWPLFLVFAKAGAVLFGSGYVLLAFLRADLVERLGWLTEPQLLDAIAIGQVTPGPVFTTATFIGYLLGGPAGAAAATIGIFLPAFVFVAVSGPLIPRLRRSRPAGAFLDGVNVASLALMAVVTWQLGRAALVDNLTIALAAASLVILARTRINSAWLILGGGAVGWLAR